MHYARCSVLTSVTAFSFTHPPVLSALLLIFSAPKFLVPDSPLLVPAPFLSSALQGGMSYFLSDGNPLCIPSNQTSRHLFFTPRKKKYLPCFSFRAAVLLRLKSVEVSCNEVLYSQYTRVYGSVCVCVCVCVCEREREREREGERERGEGVNMALNVHRNHEAY